MVVCYWPLADLQKKNKIKRIFTTEDTESTEENLVIVNAPAARLTIKTSVSSVSSVVNSFLFF